MRHIHFESSFRRMLGAYVACLRFAPLQVLNYMRRLHSIFHSHFFLGLCQHVHKNIPEKHRAVARVFCQHCGYVLR